MDGSWTAHDLVERTRSTEGCSWDWSTESHLETWVLSPPPARTVLTRVFERGSYHLVGGALRYRRGEGGRQPLTPERIMEGRLTGHDSPGDALVWNLVLSTPPGSEKGSRWRGSLR